MTIQKSTAAMGIQHNLRISEIIVPKFQIGILVGERSD